MSKVKIQGNASGTGVLTVTAPNTSTDRTITLPDTTGTLLDENSSVPAANLTGTVADARFPATLPAISAANLTAIPAANITGTLPAISGANLTGLSSGLSEVDRWDMGTEFTFGSGEQVLTANWARDTTSGYSKIGTGMSQSSGIFTFPSTGIYEIHFNIPVYNTNMAAYMHSGIRTTINNSSYTSAANTFSNIAISGGLLTNMHTSHIFDVTDTANCKVKFVIYSYANSTGNVNDNTYAIFKKLGET